MEVRTYNHQQAWLFRVATNLALTERKRQANPVGKAVPFGRENEPTVDDPARQIDEDEFIQFILSQLAPKRRAVLVLREVHGLRVEEIGSILGITREAVRMTLSRAREQFRTIYMQQNNALGR